VDREHGLYGRGEKVKRYEVFIFQAIAIETVSLQHEERRRHSGCYIQGVCFGSAVQITWELDFVLTQETNLSELYLCHHHIECTLSSCRSKLAEFQFQIKFILIEFDKRLLYLLYESTNKIPRHDIKISVHRLSQKMKTLIIVHLVNPPHKYLKAKAHWHTNAPTSSQTDAHTQRDSSATISRYLRNHSHVTWRRGRWNLPNLGSHLVP